MMYDAAAGLALRNIRPPPPTNHYTCRKQQKAKYAGMGRKLDGIGYRGVGRMPISNRQQMIATCLARKQGRNNLNHLS